jgi:hypothetical protein
MPARKPSDTQYDWLPNGEVVVTKTLHLSFKWNDTLPELNSMNKCLELKSIFQSGLSRIRNNSFPKYKTKRAGDNFTRCRKCDKLKSLRASSTRGSHAKDLWDFKSKEHITVQRAHRELYYANRNLFINEPKKVLTIIFSFSLQNIKEWNPSWGCQYQWQAWLLMDMVIFGMYTTF